jgi:hypothetical protein
MPVVEVLHQIGEVVVGGVAQDAEGAGAALEGGESIDRVDAVAHGAHGLCGVRAQFDRRLSRHQTTAATREQRDAEFALEPRDELGYGRLGEVEVHGCCSERTVLEGGQKCPQLTDGHSQW